MTDPSTEGKSPTTAGHAPWSGSRPGLDPEGGDCRRSPDEPIRVGGKLVELTENHGTAEQPGQFTNPATESR